MKHLWSKFVLVLAPLLAVGALMGLITATGDGRIQAAVVNLDQAVQIDGHTVPLGRQLAAEMVKRDGDNISWTLADAPSGAAGLRSGKYSAVVTIPKGFSAAASSWSANDAAQATQATIDVQVSDNAPITDAQLAQQIARLATESINATLTETYLDQVYVGFNTVGEQFVTVADGAAQLSDGTAQLADGLTQASQGAAALSDGMGVLRENTAQFQTGGTQLVSGAQQLNDATGQFVDGASALRGGIKRLAASAPSLVTGVGSLASGADGLLGSVPAYTQGVVATLEGLDQLKTSLDEILVGIDNTGSLSTQLELLDAALGTYASGAQSVPNTVIQALPGYLCPPQADAATCGLLQQAYAQGGGIGAQAGFQAGAATAKAMLNTQGPSGVTLLEGASAQAALLRNAIAQVRDGASSILAGAQPLSAAAEPLASGATELNAGIQHLKTQVGPLGEAVSQLSSGASQLSDGATRVDTAADSLADGVETYVAAAKTYSDGVVSAADGAQGLTGGIVELAAGADSLDAGMTTFATQLAAGAQEVPSYSATERAALSKVVASPVAQGDTVAKVPTTSATSLLLVAALWLGALASFAVVRPVPRNVVASSASTLWLWLHQMRLPVVVAVVQAVVLGAAGWAMMGLSVSRGVGLTGLLVALGLSFVLANHALAGWLGHLGRGLGVVLLAVTVALGMSSTEGWLAPVGLASPVQNGFEMIRAWAADGSGGVGLAGLALLFGVLAGVASVMTIGARRRLTARQFLRGAES